MMFLSFAYNYMYSYDTMAFSWIYFIVQLWSWDRSAANFNFGITVGEMFCNLKDVRGQWQKFFLVLLMQIIGGLMGVVLTLISSKITHDNDSRTTYPSVPVMCPSRKPTLCSTGGTNIQQTLKWEVIGSSLFVLSWLVIRRFPIKNKIANLIKPFLTSWMYFIFLDFTNDYSSGPLNASLAFELWIWGLGSYSDLYNPNDPKSVTIFS